MENEANPPEKHVPPPPDLPKPPPPAEKPAKRPAVDVHIKQAGSSEENEPEQVRLAPLNARIPAALIDALVATGLHLGALWILPGFLERIAWLVGIAYFVCRDSLPFLDGQSVGKKAMKLRAVTRDDKPLTENWEPALIRNGVLMIPFFGIVELIVLLTREDKPEQGLRLGDEWAKTKVIAEPATESPAGEQEE